MTFAANISKYSIISILSEENYSFYYLIINDVTLEKSLIYEIEYVLVKKRPIFLIFSLSLSHLEKCNSF